MSSDELPKNLKPLPNIPDERPEVIKALNSEQLDEVHEWMSKGLKSFTIAAKIQKKWNLFTHLATQSLQGQIETYRKKYGITTVVTTTVEDHVTGQKAVTTEVKVKEMVPSYLRGKLDAYKVQEEMVILQIGRINKIMDRENKMPTLLDQTRKELELLNKMMQNFTSLQFELGVLRRTAQVLEHHHVLTNPDLLAEEERVANKLKAIQGRSTILNKVRNVLSLVSEMDVENREIIEAEVIELEDLSRVS